MFRRLHVLLLQDSGLVLIIIQKFKNYLEVTEHPKK